jgi:hypothetical protein
VTCGVGIAWICQLAFSEVHPRTMLVFGGKPAPVIVIVEPTVVAIGETAMLGVAAAAVAGQSRRRKHSSEEVADKEIPMTLGLA